ncbi:unnamed protein product, partial [Rotaria sordida]
NRSSLTNTLRRITNEEKLNNLWVKIEITVNSIFDSSLDNRSGARVAKGIRQLEYLTIFGKKLTYTELVTRDNLHELRQLILNQPDVHPGGNFVELEDGTIRRLLPNNLFQRTACYRHIRTGDYVLVNRQPTLHRATYTSSYVITYQHFLVSKDGTPLTGLIQDHVLAGRTLTMRDRFFEKILLYIQPVNQASFNLDSKSKLSMKSCPSKSNVTNIDLMANTDVIIRHGHLLSGLIDKAHCSSTLASVVHCYYELYGKRCAADLDLHLELNDVLLLSLGVSHRRRLINQCRAQAGQKALQKTFSLSEDSNEQILINQFAKGFCSKSFDERISKEMDINYKIDIDEYQNQIVKQSMSNLFKQFQENNLQFLIQSGAKG